jgi:hypothetical protein
MAAVTEAASLMRALAEPASPGESVKAAISRAARKAGIPASLGKRLWYGEARRIDADTMDQLRERAARDTEILGEALIARKTLLARLAACEAALGLQNADADRSMGDPSSRPPRIAHRPLAGGGR